jgi:hypothetical protein
MIAGGASNASTRSDRTTSTIDRSTPVAARKPEPVRSAPNTKATGMHASGRLRATSATSRPSHPTLLENPGVNR